MSAQTNRFKRAAKVAKKLYKTGRYKKYSDAMSAAFKRIGSASNGHFNKRKSVKKKPARSRKAKKATAPRERIKNVRRTNSVVTTSEIGSISEHKAAILKHYKTRLAAALLHHALATKKTSRTGKRHWAKIARELKALIKKHS